MNVLCFCSLTDRQKDKVSHILDIDVVCTITFIYGILTKDNQPSIITYLMIDKQKDKKYRIYTNGLEKFT